MPQTFVVILAALSGTAFLIVLLGRHRLQTKRQRRLDDALKAILTADLENRALGAAGLAGFLGIGYDKAIFLIEQLSASGLICWGTGGLELTITGRQTAIRLLRAHRLTERFLVDEARMALERVHREADLAEHAMTEAQLAELNEQLGHPDWDPHGDPIPDAHGEVAHVDRYPLDSWPLQRRAVVTHVEDEPPDALRRLLAKGLRPGTALEIVSRSGDNLIVEIATERVGLPAALARQVHVRPCDVDVVTPPSAHLNLAELESGGCARILRLDAACRGFTRRRLLDLGITPGAFVQVEMTNAGGSARVYRIRDTLIALRREQAGQVIIQKESSTDSMEMTAR
jgi:DtxR family Mn-dependent transcriptional regulator